MKGEAGIDWESVPARQALLTVIVADADRLLEMARQALADLTPNTPAHTLISAGATLLGQILLQDVERIGDGAHIIDGVAADRVVSVHDPDMRHGHKSASKRFDGHKAALAVDPESQLITAATVLAGNAPDKTQALQLVEQSEANAEVVVDEAIADCAYGDGATRQEFADAGRTLMAKVPGRPHTAYFAKEDFAIDPVAKTCTCPAGHTCTTRAVLKSVTDGRGDRQILQAFRFDPALCDACPLRSQCVRAKPGQGRSVSLHPQEALLQQARAFQHSPAFAPYRCLRQVAEHRIARLVHLGIRQAHSVGRAKTLGQLLLAATVANLTLVATRVGLMRSPRRGAFRHCETVSRSFPTRILVSLTGLLRPWDLNQRTGLSEAGCRPSF